MGRWSRDSNELPFIDLVPPKQAEGEREASVVLEVLGQAPDMGEPRACFVSS